MTCWMCHGRGYIDVYDANAYPLVKYAWNPRTEKTEVLEWPSDPVVDRIPCYCELGHNVAPIKPGSVTR